MNDLDRLNLKKMIQSNDVVDQTDLIRRAKHSKQIRSEAKELIHLRENMTELVDSNFDEFRAICREKCSFLFDNYMDIFNKIIKNEIDINILSKFLDVLQNVEEGVLDQHEASFLIGKYLKELYIDSALKKSENLDKKYESNKKKTIDNNLTWKEYKTNRPIPKSNN